MHSGIEKGKSRIESEIGKLLKKLVKKYGIPYKKYRPWVPRGPLNLYPPGPNANQEYLRGFQKRLENKKINRKSMTPTYVY